MIRLVTSRHPAMPDDVAAYLLSASWDRSLTFPVVAAWARFHFGPGAPDAGEVATYLGAVLHGEPRLMRLHRDIELGEWVVANARAGTLDELLGAIRVTFGPARTPSRSALGRFLHNRLGRTGRMSDPARLAFNVRLLSFLRAEAPGRTLHELLNLCAVRFGADFTLSNSALHRLLQEKQITFGRSRAKVVETAVWTWLGWATRRWPVAEAIRQGNDRFGKARMPSRNAIYDRLQPLRRKGLSFKRFMAVTDREVLDTLRSLDGTMRTARICAELQARFGKERAPSLRTLRRALPLLRLE